MWATHNTINSALIFEKAHCEIGIFIHKRHATSTGNSTAMIRLISRQLTNQNHRAFETKTATLNCQTHGTALYSLLSRVVGSVFSFSNVNVITPFRHFLWSGP